MFCCFLIVIYLFLEFVVDVFKRELVKKIEVV